MTCIFVTSTISQNCPPGGAIFVNEVYNAGGSPTEYFELVVVGDPSAPTAPVNLEGWILDDNNIDMGGQGNATGHLVLDSEFSSVNPGAIILVYNEYFPYAPLPASNPPWLYVVSGADLDGCSDSPSVFPANPAYTPCGSAGGDWNYTQLNNTNDLVQVRNPSESFYHGVEWGSPSMLITPVSLDNRSSSLDCGDWFDSSNYDSSLPETPGDFNSALNEALIMDIRNGVLDCDDIIASCNLFVCPTITDITSVDEICADNAFDITATGLANMGIAMNTEADFGIEFVLFSGASAPADPYVGGTNLGNVAYSALDGTDPNQSATINTTLSNSGTYQLCAILDPPSVEPTCAPFACKTIDIHPNPVASLSGYHLFCPGDCHQISVVLTSGTEPYDVTFKLEVGPISFPFTIDGYDVDNQLNICFDGGLLPDYDASTNTLHVPTYITGSGTFSIEQIVDANGCQPATINPNFLTLEFSDQPDINEIDPIELCDEDYDGFAFFDLTAYNEDINGNTGLTVNWYEDANGTIAISTPGNYFSGSTTVYASVYDEDCPSDIIAVELIVTTAEYPGTDASIELCNEDDMIVDMESELGGDPGGQWFDVDGTGADLNDPTSVDLNGVDPGTYLFNYYFDATDVCPIVEATLTVTISESLNAGEDNDISICQGNNNPVDLEILLGDHDSGGEWYDLDNSGVDLSDPTQVIFSTLGVGFYNYEYTLLSTTICPDKSAIITVIIYDQPNPGNDNSLFICSSGNTIANLEEALGDHDNYGYWIDDDATGVDLSDPSAVDFNGIADGSYSFTYLIEENDGCPEASATILVNVGSAVFAGQDSLFSICQGNDQVFNFFDIITGESGSNGIWTQLSGDPVDISDPYNVEFSSTQTGIDSFLYEISNDCGADSSLLIINIIDGPNAGIDYSRFICLSIDTINLFDSLTMYETSGTWYDAEGIEISTPDSINIDSTGTFIYSYIIPSIENCPADTAFATIGVIEQPFAGRDSSIFICQGIDWNQNLFELIPGVIDSTGSWQQVSGIVRDLSDPESVPYLNVVAGVDSFLYVLESDCGIDSSFAIISINTAPNAGSNYSIDWCLDGGPFDLYSELQSYDNGGVWYDELFEIVINPNELTLDETGSNSFLYIIAASGTCEADTALAEINVYSAPFAGQDRNINFCEGLDIPINFYSLLGGNTTLGGNWEDIDQSGIDLTDAQNIQIDNLLPGIYNYTYTVDPVNAVCNPDTATITLEIILAPNPGTDNSTNICANNIMLVNLEELLIDFDALGNWSDEDNSNVDLTNPWQVDFTGIEVGTYHFTYTIPEGNGCPEASATITVNVDEAPYAGDDVEFISCELSNDDLNLIDLLSGASSIDGIWEASAHPEIDLSIPQQLNLDQFDVGSYTIEYILDEANSCMPDTALVTLIIEDLPNTGTCDTTSVCNGPSQGSIDIIALLSGQDPGGLFRELTNSGVDISDPTALDFNGILQGRYIFEYYFPASDHCPEVSTRIYLDVLASDDILFEAEICPGESFMIGSNVYDLNNPNGTEFLQNTNGCDSIVHIALSPKEIDVQVDYNDADCFGFGEIQVLGIQNTNLPITLVSDELGTIEITELPQTINQIPPGNHTLHFEDDNLCADQQTISILEFPGFISEMPDEVTINLGDSYQIELITDIEPLNINWWPETDLDCTTCLNPLASPKYDTEYIVNIIDDIGCTLMDSILIRVEQKTEVYLPNVFSPNGDDKNQRFFAKSNVENSVYDLSIFDRWGNLIFKGESLAFNDAYQGWDGYYNGVLLNPGVYVYVISYELEEGRSETLSGDILLLR